jgi:hypothetical protein
VVRLAWLFSSALLALAPSLLQSQADSRIRGGAELFVGSEMDAYLRVLQVAGGATPYPWSIRAFSPAELDRLLVADEAHPWALRYSLVPDARSGLRLELVRPRTQLFFNSAFPYGSNDGPVWAGRGLTAAVDFGIAARYGPLSLTIAPMAFWSQNADFDLAPTGRDGRLAFADGRFPATIDLPQRFGDEPYARVDPGQSTLRLDLRGLAAGISTANQHWGPAVEYPILLGSNAPGYLHGFVGTSSPVDLWLARLHGRMVWGRLDQSEFGVLQGPASRRFMSGVIGMLSPRGAPGLEIGAARFFHTLWPEEGLRGSHFTKPLESFLKTNLSGIVDPTDDEHSDADNQLASVFFRWVLPRSGFEAYGEFGREDHNWDLRDFWLQPDHDSAYMLGLRRVWPRAADHWVVFRGEVANAQTTHLERVRHQVPFYIHEYSRQGHTQRGQLLGAAAIYGGSGTTLGIDYLHPGGRWSAAFSRELRRERTGALQLADNFDVQHSLQGEALFFHGRFEVLARIAGVVNNNRDFRGDAFNLNSGIIVRAGF